MTSAIRGACGWGVNLAIVFAVYPGLRSAPVNVGQTGCTAHSQFSQACVTKIPLAEEEQKQLPDRALRALLYWTIHLGELHVF